MKSLTEAQLKALLLEAWEDGASTYDEGGHPNGPTKEEIEEREWLLQHLIDKA